MAGHGGYRRPTNPAPVSGPGQHSQRTDGHQPIMELPDARYGENQSFQQAQAGAPMAQQGPLSLQQAPSLGDVTQGLTPLSAPSSRPDVPVTDGAALGPGQGPSALGIPTAMQQDASDFQKYLPILIDRAQKDGTPQSFKNMVRQLIASL